MSQALQQLGQGTASGYGLGAREATGTFTLPLTPNTTRPKVQVMPTPLVEIAAAPVVAPMILQFFILAILWVGTLPPYAPRGPQGAWWGAVLLPFLMVSTGLLFFSAPLAPLWQPVLGPGGIHFNGFPAGAALATVLFLNLIVVGWCIWASGGVARSPFVPLLVAAPVLVGLLGGATGWIFLTAVGAGLLLVIARGTPAPATPPTPPALRRSALGFWIATFVLLGIAAWLRP